MNILVFLAMTALLMLLAIEDIRERMVSDKYTISFVFLSLMVCHSKSSALLGIGLVAIAIIYDKHLSAIGSGDIIMYGAFLIYFGFETMLWIMIFLPMVQLIAYSTERLLKIEYFSNEKGIVGMPFFLLTFIVFSII